MAASETAAAGPSGLDRRQLLLSGGLLAAAVATPFTIWQRQKAGEDGPLDAGQMAVLTRVCDLVLPATDTPGAVAVGVPAFVALALQHGLEGTLDPAAPYAPPGNDYAEWLRTTLDHAVGGWFAGRPEAESHAALEALDRDAFAEGAPPSPWVRLKTLILLGYYSSEVGASKELHYELVPGRWDPDMATPADYRAFSSDWAAVEYG